MAETMVISKKEYKRLKADAEVDHDLLLKLVGGLEDIRAGRVKLWKKSTA